tara:strand:+ start:539 stop:808 length:270 start_codon:yes stop_codon:yes gene_type:complete
LPFLIALLDKNSVIVEFFGSCSVKLLFLKILIKVGSKVNVIRKDTIKPKVIIQPKSIMGLISLKISDRKAHIVVNAVYAIGQNIFEVAL